MTELMNITPDVLCWARKSAGMPISYVAEKLGKKIDAIKEWEKGSKRPTYGQLEKLANMYKRPLAIFFFPQPPQEEDIKQSFRTLPDAELDDIPHRVRYLVRQAKVFQLNMYELFDRENPAKKMITLDPDLLQNKNPITLAKKMREYLGVSMNVQKDWQSSDDALKEWRETLENFGVFVFKDSFKNHGKEQPDSSYSGFCLHDERFPIIYINNNFSKTRQIFTLFHELAHLMSSVGGVDKRWTGDLAGHLSGDALNIEILCNKFAGEFLLPSNDINKHLRNMQPEDENLSEIAARYCVSREVILRRMWDLGIVNDNFYEKWIQKERKKKKRQSGSGGNYYYTKKNYLSGLYTRRVFEQCRKRKITRDQAADYLDVKRANIDRLEALILKDNML